MPAQPCSRPAALVGRDQRSQCRDPSRPRLESAHAVPFGRHLLHRFWRRTVCSGHAGGGYGHWRGMDRAVLALGAWGAVQATAAGVGDRAWWRSFVTPISALAESRPALGTAFSPITVGGFQRSSTTSKSLLLVRNARRRLGRWSGSFGAARPRTSQAKFGLAELPELDAAE